jgi:uncharacterized protein (DUF4415 family)
MNKLKPLIDKDGEVRELTLEDLKKVKPAREVAPRLVEAWEKGELKVRGPQKAPTKDQVTLRLPHEVVEYFRATGDGWQTRMGEALLEVVHRRKAG